MRQQHEFYIDGAWVAPHSPQRLDVIDPATETVAGSIALGDADDVARAVAAARRAFPAYAETSPATRQALLRRIVEVYQRRQDDMARAISDEMGAPYERLARTAQASTGLGHFRTAAALLDDFPFEHCLGPTRVLREAAGVCALITPWNWPANQMACKVAPALAAGCTMVLKPSEVAPFSARVLAEILDEAGVPAGVFNFVNGDGAGVGSALTAHPDVDLVSFTGSTRAGIAVMQSAARTVKKVALELGGKSANLILDDADLAKAVTQGVLRMMNNSGQSCNAPSRMLVPAAQLAAAEEIAAAAVARIVVGDPRDATTTMGPVVSRAQFDKIQGLIRRGIDDGAALIAGGPGRPDGLATGYYVRPTVFSRVRNDMSIAREEIFGPVLCLLPYADEDDAVRIANDSPYGLSGYVQSASLARARAVARRLRTGMVHLNGAAGDLKAPFGGYKQSGIGREWGAFGLEDFLETKAVMGFGDDDAG